MTRFKLLAIAGGLTLVAVVTLGAASGADTIQSNEDTKQTICFVSRSKPTVERTISVSSKDANDLLRDTLSYSGPCASYGERASLGNGTMVTYEQVESEVPTAVGLAFSASVLDGLPHHPPTGGLWCYDKDGSGAIDDTECAGGHERAMQFDADHVSPFTYVLANWNPHGHIPPGVYDVPHFDLHFYLNANEERLAIDPGPCPQLTDCDDYALAKILPGRQYYPEGYVDVDAVEPAMGNHLLDPTGPEFSGQPFTHSWIYGVFDGEITFYEPMVTKQWFDELRGGTRGDGCFPIPLPRAWAKSGWYPTSYCMRYRENRNELTASLENFVYRTAS